MSDPKPTITLRKLIWPLAQLVIGLGLFVVCMWWAIPSWEEFTDKLELSAGFLLLSCAGSLMATFVGAARWKMLSETMGVGEIRYGAYFHYMALTRVLGQILPGALVELVGRGTALRVAGSRSAFGNLLAPVLIERIFDLLLPLCLFFWAIAVHFGPGTGSLGPWGSLALVVVVFAVLGIVLLRPMVAASSWALTKYRTWRGKAVHEFPVPEHVPPKLSVWVMVFSIIRFAGILVQYWGAGVGFGVTLAALTLVSAAPLAQLAAMVGITPGGLGIQEGGWVAALQSLGEDPAAIAVFMTGTRVTMLASFALFSAASWPWRKA